MQLASRTRKTREADAFFPGGAGRGFKCQGCPGEAPGRLPWRDHPSPLVRKRGVSGGPFPEGLENGGGLDWLGLGASPGAWTGWRLEPWGLDWPGSLGSLEPPGGTRKPRRIESPSPGPLKKAWGASLVSRRPRPLSALQFHVGEHRLQVSEVVGSLLGDVDAVAPRTAFAFISDDQAVF